MGGFGSTLGLYFEIAADPSNAEKALKDFQSSVASSLGMTSTSFGLIASDIETKLGVAQGSLVKTGLLAKSVAVDLAYVGGALGVVGGALFAAAEKAAHFAEQIGHVSEKSGATVEQVSTLKFAADRVGVSFETVDKSLGFLAKNLGNLGTAHGAAAARALADIEVQARKADGSIRPISTLLPLIVEGLGKMSAGGVKTADTVALFGRGGKELIPVLNSMRDGFDAVEAKARSMGLVLGRDDVIAADAFLLSQRTLTAEVQGFTLHVGQKLIPLLSVLFLELEHYPLLLDTIAARFKVIADIAASPLTGGLSLVLLKGHMDELTNAQNKLDETVAKGMAALDAEARAALAAGINIDQHGGATEKAAKQTKVWTTDLSALNSIYRELHGTLDPVTQANEKYRQILERIATATGPGYNGTLLEKMALEQRDATVLKEFLKDQENIDKAITKHVPMMSADVLAMQKQVAARNLLTEVQRAALPLGMQLNNIITRELQASQAIVLELEQHQLPARRKIELQIQRQIDAANREIIALRQQYDQHRITRAEMEASEQAYSDLMVSLTEQRKRALQEETLAQISSITMQGAALLQTLGFRKAAAIVETIWETAESIKAFANLDFYGGTMHALAAAQYAIVAGQSSKSSGMYGAVSAAVPGGTVGGSTAIGSKSASTSSPALAPGAASAAAAGQEQNPANAPQPIIIHIHGDFLSTPHSAEVLAKILSDAVEQRDVPLTSRRALLPAYVTR